MLSKILPLITLLAGSLVTGVASTSDLNVAPHLRGKRSLYERDGVKRTIFEHEATKSSIDYVTNSGICETTPGVNQYSGYLNIGTNESLWFWFFESRSSPQTAPLATWFNGGPGCSSMVGLFQENGPCHFLDSATEPSLNPYSWNTYANMLYVDQPFGVGFSNEYELLSNGNTRDTSLEVNTTAIAATNVWKLLQAFYAQFPQYENRDFGLFTESYGGHYGPEFASYFESQNAGIANGSVTGQNISLVAMAISNGWYDSMIQEKAYIDFSLNNSYGALINESFAADLYGAYNKTCLPLATTCNADGLRPSDADNKDCRNADEECQSVIDDPLYDLFGSSFNVYDIRPDAAQPSNIYVNYLNSPSVLKAIGAKSSYEECSSAASGDFYMTGDHARDFLPALSSVVSSGVQVTIWAGDADFICNWFGALDSVNAINFTGSDTFRASTLNNYTVNGTTMGTFKTDGKLSFLRVFESGHEVPFYQPQVALQVFQQTMGKQGLFSTESDGSPTTNGTGTPTGSGAKPSSTKKGGSGISAKPKLLVVSVCLLLAIVAFG